MTRFVSKNSNLRLIIESGFPASPLTGQLARPGISVKFQNGMVDVQDEEIVKKLLALPSFNIDFVSAEDTKGRDPFSATREEMEPIHVLSEVNYGHVEKSVSSPRSLKLPAQLEALVNAKAAEMAKAMLPELLRSLASMEKETKAATEPAEVAAPAEEASGSPEPEVTVESEPKAPKAAPKKMGRPKKAVVPESTPTV